jgi:hypothetical protein
VGAHGPHLRDGDGAPHVHQHLVPVEAKQHLADVFRDGDHFCRLPAGLEHRGEGDEFKGCGNVGEGGRGPRESWSDNREPRVRGGTAVRKRVRMVGEEGCPGCYRHMRTRGDPVGAAQRKGGWGGAGRGLPHLRKLSLASIRNSMGSALSMFSYSWRSRWGRKQHTGQAGRGGSMWVSGRAVVRRWWGGGSPGRAAGDGGEGCRRGDGAGTAVGVPDQPSPAASSWGQKTRVMQALLFFACGRPVFHVIMCRHRLRRPSAVAGGGAVCQRQRQPRKSPGVAMRYQSRQDRLG